MLKWGSGVGCYATAFAEVDPRCGKIAGVKKGNETSTSTTNELARDKVAEVRDNDGASTSTSTSTSAVAPPPTSSSTSREVTTLPPTPAIAQSSIQQRRDEKARTTHWLAIGAKDGKVSLWDIY